MITDVLSSLNTFLSANWINTNTGNRTPKFDLIENKKRIDMGFQDKDFVLIQKTDESIEDIAIGGGNKKREITVVINLFTKVSRAQMYLMAKELERILVANEKNNPLSDTSIDIQDLENITEQTETDKMRKIWRWIGRIKLIKFIETF